MPYQKVVNFAVDFYMDTAEATQRLANQSADADRCGHGPAKGTVPTAQGPQPSVVDILIQDPQKDKLPWRIPESVPKGYEIPIVLSNAEEFPRLGTLRRYGMDIVVNATWVALVVGQEREQRGCAESAAARKVVAGWSERRGL